jgi:hypothetical protein
LRVAHPEVAALAVPIEPRGFMPKVLYADYDYSDLGLALALVRNIVAYHRDIQAGKWHYLSSGPLRRKAAQNNVTWLATGRPDYVVVAGTRRR